MEMGLKNGNTYSRNGTEAVPYSRFDGGRS